VAVSGRTVGVSKSVVAALLATLTLAVFAQVSGFQFLSYDDTEYVTGNARVRGDLTPAGVAWAFTTMTAANWHPLTWISHMADWSLYGPRAGGHHVTSLILHLASVLLLFQALCVASGATVPSGVVAALFAIHPLHVESVAWIAERKDVLSTLFLMLALLAYARYAKRPSRARFAWVALAMAAGLLAKPMLVTLPVLLLILDYWPLGRLASKADLRTLAIEKLPLVPLVVASSIVTFVAQARWGAVRTLEQLPFAARAENALVSYVRYLAKAAWPTDLAVFYPYTELPPWQVGLALVVLGGVTYGALRLRRSHPALITGWLWYLVSLLPVLGLVQVGEQAIADRYTYVPMIGPFLAVAWGVPAIPWLSSPARRAGAVVWIAALAFVAHVQAGYWRDTLTLFRHTLRVTEGNYVAHQVVGDALAVSGALDEAVGHYEEALRARPDSRVVQGNLAGVLYLQGKMADAERHAREALAIDPRFARARTTLGLALAEQGKPQEAIAELERGLAIEPDNVPGNYNLGMLLFRQGRLEEAVACFRRVVAARPEEIGAYGYLARARLASGDVDGARREIEAGRAHGFVPSRELREQLDHVAAGR